MSTERASSYGAQSAYPPSPPAAWPGLNCWMHCRLNFAPARAPVAPEKMSACGQRPAGLAFEEFST